MNKAEMIEKAAIMAHEANRQYCRMLGDDSQPSWNLAPDWQKASARVGVEGILDHPEMTPEQSHANWFEFKKADGWVWGEVKNAEKKEHPCMVPYSHLPVTQRFKDYLFQAVVRATLLVE
jgi:RyR domain